MRITHLGRRIVAAKVWAKNVSATELAVLFVNAGASHGLQLLHSPWIVRAASCELTRVC